MNIAIIPARGGSKRIPKKNIRDFNGKPIIAYSIKAALNSGCFDRVIVSTDDRDIASVSQRHGAEVPYLRSEETSDDYASIADVVLETLETLEQDEALRPAYLCCIFATAPFVTGERLKKAFDTMVSENKNGIFPMVEYSYPIQRSLEVKPNGTVGMVWPEHARSRSQDLPPRYHDSGQYYWAKVESVKAEKNAFRNKLLRRAHLELTGAGYRCRGRLAFG